MSGIAHVELDSVDGYAIAGTAAVTIADSNYYVTTFPCDVMVAIAYPSLKTVLWRTILECIRLSRRGSLYIRVLGGSPDDNAYTGYVPVTNTEYKQFNQSRTYPQVRANYPVINFTYAQAEAYCTWLGLSDTVHAYRLTTEDEWIMAAGKVSQVYQNVGFRVVRIDR